MGTRAELQSLLAGLLDEDDAGNVYFQPPPSVNMKYPCIIYHRDFIDIKYAGNKPYKNKKRYQVTIVDRDPDSVLHEKVGELPLSSYDRFYTADGLNHDVYNLYF